MKAQKYDNRPTASQVVEWTVKFVQEIDGNMSARDAASAAAEDGAGTVYTKTVKVQAYDSFGNKIGNPKYIARDDL